MRISVLLLMSLFFLSLVVPRSSWAYFGGRVTVQGAELKQAPNDSSTTIQTLDQGTAFNAADNERDGYYYIRTSAAQGWVKAESIGKGAGGDNTAPAPPPANTGSTRRKKKKTTSAATKSQPDQRKYTYGIKVFDDLDLFSASSLNTAAGTTGNQFANGVGIGGEFEYFFNPRWAFVFRIEDISKSVSGSDASGDTLAFSLSSLALSPGVEYMFFENQNFYLSGLGFIGIAPTKLSLAVSGNYTATGSFSKTAINVLGMVEGGWRVADWLNIYGELGYRSLSASNVVASSVQNASASTFYSQTLTINLSGPVIGLGLGARF